MQNERIKWRALRAARASKRLDEIEASITAFRDKDLLDFADIFVEQPRALLGNIASAEMKKRKISL